MFSDQPQGGKELFANANANANPDADGTNFSTTTHLSCLPQHPELGSYSKFAKL
jgi:hypothetical protein